MITRAVVLVLIAGLAMACVPAQAPGGAGPLPAVQPTTLPGGTDLLPTEQPAGATPAPTTLPGGTDLLPTEQPSGTAPVAGVRFEIVAKGDPMVSVGETPIMTAILNDGAGQAIPAGLPAEAKTALEAALAKPDAALYVVVFLGKQPSSGYGVEITSITPSSEGGKAGLAVHYSFEKPDPAKGGATVLTYPYVIASVQQAGVAPENVTFQAP